MNKRAFQCFISSATKDGGATQVDALVVREKLHDAIQALAVKKTDLGQQCAGHVRRGKAALAAGDRAKAIGCAHRQQMVKQHMVTLEGLQLNLERIYGELDVLHTVVHAHHALSVSSVALEQTLKQIDLGRVTDLLDTIDDQLARGQEAGTAMAVPLLHANDDDEDAAAQMLAEWSLALEEPAAAVAVAIDAAELQLRPPPALRVALEN